jgi:hypothetical protein
MPFRRLLGGACAALVAFTGLWLSTPAPPASAAIPTIRIKVPPIEVSPTVGRPLRQSEWRPGNTLYEQRLSAAGDDATLAVEETVRLTPEERLRVAIRECGKEGATSALDGSAQELVNTGEAPTLNAAVGYTIGGCLSSQLPDETPPEAIDEMASYLADQLVEPADEAIQTSSAVDVSLTFPGTATGSTAGSDPVPTSSPTDDGSSFPWAALVVIGGIALLAAAYGTSRKRS